MQPAQLVPRQRLGGEQKQSGVRRVFQRRLGDRDLIAERLSRRGARGHHDDAFAVAHEPYRPGLMSVEALDPVLPEPGGEIGVQVEVVEDPRALGHRLDVGNAL